MNIHRYFILLSSFIVTFHANGSAGAILDITAFQKEQLAREAPKPEESKGETSSSPRLRYPHSALALQLIHEDDPASLAGRSCMFENERYTIKSPSSAHDMSSDQRRLTFAIISGRRNHRFQLYTVGKMVHIQKLEESPAKKRCC